MEKWSSRKDEAWRRARVRMDRVSGRDKAKALIEVLQEEGISVSEAIQRVVEDQLGKEPTEDQVRELATRLAWIFGMRADRFVALWREASRRR